MKVKTLLLAAIVATMSLSAVAAEDGTAYTNCGDKLTAENVIVKPGEVQVINFTLTRLASPNFTNIQFDIIFPEGIIPTVDADGDMAWPGTLSKFGGKKPVDVINFKHNMNEPENYPVYRIVGANAGDSEQQPETQNPCQLYCINITANSTTPSGEYQLKAANLKYTCLNNDSYATADEQVVCTITVENEDNPTAVNDLNSAKAVSSVKYVNVAGAESNVPFDGVNIMVTTYADGTTQTAKVIK